MKFTAILIAFFLSTASFSAHSNILGGQGMGIDIMQGKNNISFQLLQYECLDALFTISNEKGNTIAVSPILSQGNLQWSISTTTIPTGVYHLQVFSSNGKCTLQKDFSLA